MTAHTRKQKTKMITDRPWIEYRCKACGKVITQRQGVQPTHSGCPKAKHSNTRIVAMPKFKPII